MTSSRYTIPDLPSVDELLPYLRQIDENRWYTNHGPLSREFEARLATHLNKRDAASQQGPIWLVSVSTGHHALVIAMRLLRLPKRAQVLVPSITFPSSAFAIEEAGAVPVFTDIDPTNWSLTPEIARKIASRRKVDAVMTVAVYGVPVTGWDAFTKETGIPVVIDAAAALDVQPVPEHGLVAHSMHATKPFGIVEGGLLASRDPAIIQTAREMSNFGTRERIAYDCGMNAKLSEYHAAVALAQLDRWQGIKDRRRNVFNSYVKALAEHGLTSGLQKDIDQAVTSCLMLKLQKPEAQRVVEALNAKGISAHRCYWPPLPHHPHFADAEKAEPLRNAEELNHLIMGLPFHAFMTEEEVTDTVRLVVEEISRG